MADLTLVPWSLERVALLHGDPTQAVYDALFSVSPDTERLFALDREGAARGNMLANIFEVIFDLSGPHYYGANMVRAEMLNHEGLGVSPTLFASFFPLVRDVIRGLLKGEWTRAIDEAWEEILETVRQATSPADVTV